jgi:hypothetical protein
LAVACLTLVVAACGGGSLTLSEYSEQAADLIFVVRDRVAALDAEWLAETPTPEGVEAYWDGRIAARTEFLEGLRALDPPDEAADLHENVVALFERLTAAEEALAARIVAYESLTQHWQGWDTPEGQVAQAVDQELAALCVLTQAELDKTQSRELLAEMSWFPSDMKEVVNVVLGCDL